MDLRFVHLATATIVLVHGFWVTPLSWEEWKYAFGTSFTEEKSRETYERYATPGSGHVLWQGILANFQPGHQVSWLDFKNEGRPPLLIISGADDALTWALEQTTGETVTDLKAEGSA